MSLTLTPEQLDRLRPARYPRAATYDPAWALEHLMGPNVLWLAEALTQVMALKPGQRVLDLGCGTALSSIFLAREFDVQVWATDLWIPATENLARIEAAGVGDRVFPIHAEAHALPYAEGFFDAVISLDAYHYFGTNDLYIGVIARLLRPGGRIGIVVPGLQAEFPDGVPPQSLPYWDWEFGSFHSPAWWRRHWDKTRRVTVTHADVVPDGWQDWRLWLEVCRDLGHRASPEELALLEADQGRTLAFARVVAERAAE